MLGADLARVRVDGDLLRIDVGDRDLRTPALGKLRVGSLGGHASEDPDWDFHKAISTFSGGVNRLHGEGDISNVVVAVTGSGHSGRLGELFIGGSLVGGTFAGAGLVSAHGGIGRVEIEGDVRGGEGASSGVIESDRHIGSMTIGGSLLGGEGYRSGVIRTGGVDNLGALAIGGNIIGGAGDGSGAVDLQGRLGIAMIGGSVVGGAGDGSGRVFADGPIGTLRLGGDLEGGSAVRASGVRGDGFRGSGIIATDAYLGRLEIAGSVLGGSGFFSGGLYAQDGFGTVKIAGNLHGDTGVYSATIGSMGAIERLSIGGSVRGGAGHFSGNIRPGLDPLEGVSDNSGIGVLTLGSVRGGAGEHSGLVLVPGRVDHLKVEDGISGGTGPSSGIVGGGFVIKARIGADVTGGAGVLSGAFGAGGVVSLVLDGSLRGGEGGGSGYISISRAGGIRIAGDVVGGSGFASGEISSNDEIRFLRIQGSLIGGTGTGSAEIVSHAFGSVVIEGDVRGVRTSYDSIGHARQSAGVFTGKIDLFAVGGSIHAASPAEGAEPVTSYALFATGRAERVAVGGSLVGVEGNRIGITAGSLSKAGGFFDYLPKPSHAGIGIVGISGRVEQAEISAGWALTQGTAGRNADARIEAVYVRGDWIASSLSAGIAAGADRQFGTEDDGAVPSDAPQATRALSQIGRVAIGGNVFGTTALADGFAFLAERIEAVAIAGRLLPLTRGPDDLALAPATQDVRLREAPPQ
jgi:hypothetical protein